ncbi:hypothetical protein N6H18_06670 [Reichenbachiella agarivorans]|uniref:Uncharacterized protein n=1 Tax=Reichenbachiella agarivorans TaxID=2979464 RepID=A0ABY6CSZ0_9BACT|nr:hypothetical protein [Reichenbachiella agarivorans]UXP33636.1 hypothetical protein N6H18_06670 [Reichenbachiella agarivorans]
MSEEVQSTTSPLISLLVVAGSIVTLHFSMVNTDPNEKVTYDNVIIIDQNYYTEEVKPAVDEDTSTQAQEIRRSAPVKKVNNARADSLFFAKMLSQSPTYDTPAKKTIIRYYVKDLDFGKIKALEKYGFYIHERPSPLKETYATNALYVGDSVTNHDVLLVAYTLIESGVVIKSISFSREHAGWKSHSIEIGTDTTILDAQPMTLGDLKEDWGRM